MAALRRTVLLLVSIVALVAAVLTAPAVAGGAGHHHPRPGGYLALGDSVVFGYRPTAVTPPAAYLDARHFVGYPELLARGRHSLRPVANASCPGETTGSMISPDATSNGCENSLTSDLGYRDLYPLHTSYAGTQLGYAVGYLRHHPRTRLVTLGIGANDLFVCEATQPAGCTGDEFTALLAQVGSGVDTILSTLRGAAHYRHRLVVVTYYSLDYADPVATGAITALDATLAAAARAHGALVADGFTAFQRVAAAYGGDSCAAGLLIPLPTGGCDIHPTRAGQRLLAQAVRTAA